VILLLEIYADSLNIFPRTIDNAADSQDLSAASRIRFSRISRDYEM